MRYYLDCEFNGYQGGLISMALVRDDGPELYLAWPRNDCIPWVEANVVPIVECRGASPHMVRLSSWGGMIETFLRGDSLPTVIADWPDDIRYFCECLITSPGEMIDIPTDRAAAPYNRVIQFVVERIDAYPTDLPGAVQHNALWDARALRHKLSIR
jgi:hypothetical protein